MPKDTLTYNNEEGILKSDIEREIEERWRYTSKHYANWETVAKEDYAFALGEQWSEDDRNTLKKMKRPALTFNRIRPIINLVSGYQRENSSRIKVNPEGGEDRIFSESMDRSLKHVDKVSHLSYKMGYWFDDGLYTGKGWMEAIISYDKDPIRGQLKFRLTSPYQILPDPDFLEYDLNEGAKYCFKVVRLPKSDILELYPNKAKLIRGFRKDNDDRIENGAGLLEQEGDADNYGEDANKVTIVKRSDDDHEPDLEQDAKFTVKEYWKLKRVTKYFVMDKDSGEPRQFDTKEEAESFAKEQGMGRVIDRKVPEMWVHAYVCGFILQEEKSPFEPYSSMYPFFRYLADWAPNASSEVLRTQGMTRPLKDPQKEKNKAKSQFLHILNTQANSGWIGDEDALTEEGWADLKKMGSVPGLVVKKKKGYELREILPKGPSQGQIYREEKADEEFKQISGVNPDLMGFQEGTASGRAISMRIKQAVLALVRLFANYRYSKEIVGNFILEMIPMLFDIAKMKKVLGTYYMKNATDPEKYPEGLSDGHIEAFLAMVKDHKYDVYVSESDQNATIRFEIFQELADLLGKGAPIPMSLIIDYMDLPNSEEVKRKIKEFQQQQAAAAQAGKK